MSAEAKLTSQEADVAALIRSWVLRGDTALMELMPLCEPLNDLPAEHRHKRAVMLISSACWGTSQTVLYLVHGLRLWDAEVLMRSISEGTTKFGYILESPSTFAARCIEYRDVLPAIAKLRWHARAEAALNAQPPTASGLERKPYRDLLLPEEELASIRASYPRGDRANLERRWGFTELIEAVSRPGGAFGPMARTLLHGYSLASHLYHMSYEGVDMPLERDTRDAERRDAIRLAHAASLLSDCYHLALLRLIILLRFLGRTDNRLHSMKAKNDVWLNELSEASAMWSRVEYLQTASALET